jgi:hypothetical protein
MFGGRTGRTRMTIGRVGRASASAADRTAGARLCAVDPDDVVRREMSRA